jgi:tetratricopeptide (TPR) repeat protein/transcriptional regulator with XRE-family HTH domain
MASSVSDGDGTDHDFQVGPAVGATRTVRELGRLLRQLRRREARRRGEAQLTYRDLAARTGWSRGIIGEYLSGKVLPPTDRFDVLIRLLGATPVEQGALATARDRVEEQRRTTEPALVLELPATVGPAVPRELPPDVYGFTGRTEQLAELDALLDRPAGAGSVVISAVSGTAGVGKTALAVHWGHRVADRFPDGQLYVDLRGYDPDQPLTPAGALAGFLRSLGVTNVPADVTERAARYRTLLAGRRMLVVLDNAFAADQVRPLLPGSPSCLVLVTSRDDLAGLVARDGARRVDLDVLSPPDALALLRTLIGARVDADPEAADALAQRCARLPLALRVAAELAATRGEASLTDLLDDLRDEHRRLDVLDASGDPRTAVRAVFAWSYQHLSPEAARAFALLGLHPGREIEPYAVAALADLDLGRARRLVDELVRAHLVAAAGRSRYAMHDLLRAYAAQRAASDVDSDDAHAALGRLLDHYRHTANRAMSALFPHETDQRPVPPDATTAGPPLADATAATAWLETERANLVAAGCAAAEHGWPRYCVDLSRALWRYFELRAHYHDALTLHTYAVRAAHDLADAASLADVLTNLGLVHERMGRRREALAALSQALRVSSDASDLHGQARAHATLGAVQAGLGRYGESLDHLEQAIAIHRTTGDRHGEGRLLTYLGLLHERQGRLAEAAEYQSQAAALLRETGDRHLEGYALGNLGAIYSHLGRYAEALDHLGEALVRCREGNDRAGIGEVLASLGSVHRRMGSYVDALDHLQRSLVIAREIGNRTMEAETLNALAETRRAMGQPRPALVHHRAALAVARRTGHRRQAARALDGLGHALHDLGQPARARNHWQQALAIYADLDVPEAAQVRVKLDESTFRSVGSV